MKEDTFKKWAMILTGKATASQILSAGISLRPTRAGMAINPETKLRQVMALDGAEIKMVLI